MMSLSRTLSLVLLVTGLATVGLAQGPCPIFGDDGFNPGCSNIVTTPNIPNFGFTSTRSSYGCFLNCSLDADFPVQARFGYSPTTLCDVSTINVNVVPLGSTGPVLSGLLIAKYSRTFTLQQTVAGAPPRQVWRFIVNGDLTYNVAASGAAPCPTPPDAFLGVSTHFVGTVDYICDPTTSANYDVRYDLSHLPGCISHAPFSQVPLVGPAAHNDRSYHIVGPAPFLWMPLPAPQGSLNGEAIRTTRVAPSPFTWVCIGEAPVRQGALTTVGNTCPCPSVTTAPQNWFEQRLDGITTCGSSVEPFSSVPVPGITGSGGLMALGLGSYPDGTRVHTYFGLINHTDVVLGDAPFHIVHGSATSYPGGFRSFHPTVFGGPSRTALDLGNSLPLSAGLFNIGWGSLHLSRMVFQFNL